MDVLVEKITERLRQERIDHALASLAKPRTDTDPRFAYGVVCGFQQGLEHALDVIKAVLTEDEESAKRKPEPSSYQY